MVMAKATKPSPMNSGNERMPTGPLAVVAALVAPAMAPDLSLPRISPCAQGRGHEA